MVIRKFGIPTLSRTTIVEIDILLEKFVFSNARMIEVIEVSCED